MRKLTVLLCLGILSVGLCAYAPTVPRTINFAGLTLKLNEKARGKIQAEVNALTKNPKYFQIKVDRLQMYFPIIERIFREEGLPEDFKFLVLQESALISDAVSSSKAVGYWQFKKEAAEEVGLRVDRYVDERVNIVSSSRGAARYIKKNNRLYFDNWLHALLAYQQGPGGAQKLVNEKYRGARSMPVNGHTHWYVIKFLAHKIAFEQVSSASTKLFLTEFYDGQSMTLKQIALQKSLPVELVMDYNKWLKRGKIPEDKPYAVILPFSQLPAEPLVQRRESVVTASANRNTALAGAANSTTSIVRSYRTQQEKYPMVYGASGTGSQSKLVKINGLPGVMVGANENLAKISDMTGVSEKRLLYYNDLSGKRPLRQGELLYLKAKRSKAKTHYHIMEPGEDLWSVSQRYGVRLKKLHDKNRITKTQQAKPGRVLWLRFIRPSEEPVAYENIPKTTKPPYTAQPVTSSGRTPAPRLAADTARPQQATKQLAVGKQPPDLQTETLHEEEEYELDEPVNFVGVDKSDNFTNSSEKVHMVQAGETLYAISRKYEVSVSELQRMNNLGASDPLRIGQQLTIAEGSDNVEITENVSQYIDNEFIIHEVQPGETLYQIARDYKATIKELMEWNHKSGFEIAVGEELRLRKRP